MKTMVILGNDKIGLSAMQISELTSPNFILIIDKSTNIKRVFRLVLKGRLGFVLLLKMLLCEIHRPTFPSITKSLLEVKSNKDLISAIYKYKPSRIILFRAGLIISREVIALGIPLMNIHCAKVPKYGGIGSIQSALTDGDFSQCATLHQVTTTIDQGIIFEEVPYILDPNKSYCCNENIAYLAGLTLLRRCLIASPVMEKME